MAGSIETSGFDDASAGVVSRVAAAKARRRVVLRMDHLGFAVVAVDEVARKEQRGCR